MVLLTNDQGNKQKAEESGLLVYKCEKIPWMLSIFEACVGSKMISRPLYFSVEEYIKSLIANPELMDRLALSEDDKVK